MNNVTVIGAGPAGMMAAITAAKNGNNVTLAEKNSTPGKKLLITGKGRCNLTNSCSIDEFIANTPVNGRFLYSVLRAFSNTDLMAFFENRGIKLKEERGGRIFPQSDKAADILNALVTSMKTEKVRTIHGRASEITVHNSAVTGVKLDNGSFIEANSVIIATGGSSYPLTGSTGDGYALASALGHDIIPPKPSLVPLEVLERSIFAPLQGLSLRNISLKVLDGKTGKLLYDDFGELLFTHFGVSGPVILSASAFVRSITGCKLEIDLKPALSEEKLEERIKRDFEMYSNKNFVNALTDLLPSKMIPVVADICGIDHNKKINQITKEDRRTLVHVLKHFTLTVKAPRPIAEAIVTSGGVSTKQINPSTMESKLVKGLFFAGEVIDVDAYTGGFNLQIAFSTGHAAGKNA